MSRKPELKGRAARLARLFPSGPGQAARTPFVLLVVLLLGGGLIGLLVLNSALSAGAFQLDDLQRDTKSLTDEEQALQRDVDAYSAPDALQRRARELGMVPGGDPAFLNPDGSVRGVPSAAAEQSSVSVPVIRPPDVLLPASAPTPTETQAAGGPGTPAEPSTPAEAQPPTEPAAPAAPTTTPGQVTEPSPQPTQPATNPGR
ncbi:septum formation initiator family protein [Streptomyces sp. NBC_00878]|uniref:FtsB family cell division protein n=1 Tax=Streptomyces sp. NBC_00878 TaxID=2975854 RepID=UPI0022592CFF|nr:septum formation initiator family protein [Streptomyces sp. NBC_00878]MCX4909414.1 septum formation initiator family protein [Streptomyces sp. NBC_00878]